jgi:AcrR family transcriptional regulator
VNKNRKHSGARVAESGSAPRAAPVSGYEKGAQTRDHLVRVATRIFAAKGFAGATTREICQAAGVNLAAIHYYFGDKDGLYRAALLEPIRAITSQFGDFATDELPFEQAIRAILAPLIALSLREDDHELNVARLHLREMLEPSPIFRDIVEREIAPLHAALAGLVARHCGLAKPDAEVHQLSFAMIAMANDYCSSREFIRILAPAVLSRRNACEAIVDRLVGYCVALLAHEQGRRNAQPEGRGRGRRSR